MSTRILESGVCANRPLGRPASRVRSFVACSGHPREMLNELPEFLAANGGQFPIRYAAARHERSIPQPVGLPGGRTVYLGIVVCTVVVWCALVPPLGHPPSRLPPSFERLWRARSCCAVCLCVSVSLPYLVLRVVCVDSRRRASSRRWHTTTAAAMVLGILSNPERAPASVERMPFNRKGASIRHTTSIAYCVRNRKVYFQFF